MFRRFTLPTPDILLFPVEGTNTPMNKQKSIPKAGQELRDIFRRVIGWVDCGEMLQGRVTERALDILWDIAKAVSGTWWPSRGRSGVSALQWVISVIYTLYQDCVENVASILY
jgi:hypothetical protein